MPEGNLHKMPHSTTSHTHPHLLPLLLLLLLSPHTASTQNSTSPLLPSVEETPQLFPSTLTEMATALIPSSMTLTQTPTPSFSTETSTSSGLEVTSTLDLQSSPSPSTSTPLLTPVVTAMASTSMEILIIPTPTPEGPKETPTEDSSSSLLLPIPTIAGIAAGGVGLLLCCLLCLFCCWRCFCYINPKHRYYYTAGPEMRVTAQYWTEGSAHYTVTRQDSIGSRASSIRSSLGLRPKVRKNRYSNGDHVTYENQAAPQYYSTPL